MLELSGWASMVHTLGTLYWLLAFAALIAAFRLPRKSTHRIFFALIVCVGFGYGPASIVAERKTFIVAHEVPNKAFADLCKTAGEKIYQTYENVDSVLLIKLRPKEKPGDLADQMYPAAAFAEEEQGEAYIETFLLNEESASPPTNRGALSSRPTPSPGYHYVQYVDPSDGIRYRYSLQSEFDAKKSTHLASKARLVKEPAVVAAPRFAVTFLDDVNIGVRKYWIAGSTVKIIDTQTDGVIAEFVRYRYDGRFGDQNGGRSPWLTSPVCPQFHGNPSASTRFFVDRVLKPAPFDK